MAGTTVPTTPGSTTPGFFQQPQLAPSPNLEPPGFDLLRSLLMQKIFSEEASPYGLAQGASPQGLYAGAGRGMFNPYQGGYSGAPQGGQPVGMGPMPQPAQMAQLSGQLPQEGMNNPMPSQGGGGGGYGFDGYTLNNQITHKGDFDGCRMGYDSSTLTGGQIPNEGQPPSMFNTTTPAPNPQAGLQAIDPYASTSWMQQHSYDPFNNPSGTWQNASGSRPLGGSSPWEGMNRSQFQSSMGNNVGGGGLSGIQQILGPNWRQQAQSAPQMNLPGFGQATGGRHELGGNPFIGTAAANAGWTPQQTALWTAQGYLGNQVAPGSMPNYRWNGPGTTGASTFDGRRIGYDMPMPGAPPAPMAGPQPGGMGMRPHRPPMMGAGPNPQHAAALHAIMAAIMAKKRGMAARRPPMPGAPPQGMPAPPMGGPRPMGMDSPYMFQRGPMSPLGMDGQPKNPFAMKPPTEAKFVVAGRGGRPHRLFDQPRTV